jgi:hypothetical protein
VRIRRSRYCKTAFACALVVAAAACSAAASRIDLTSREVSIGTYQDTRTSPVGVTVTYPGAQLSVQVPDPTSVPWLSVDVSDHGGTAVLQIFTDVTKAVPGTYHADLTLTAAGGLKTALPITFMVWEPFRVSTSTLDVTTTLDGGSTGPATPLEIFGAQSRWQASTTAPWLMVDPSSGDGSGRVRVTCDKSMIASPGVLATNLQVTDLVGGRSQAVAIRCIADSLRLLVDRHGVAFSRFSNVAALTADIGVNHNGSEPIDWSASAAPGWLSVTASGTTGEAVHISADPSGLAPGVHIGTVTIGSSASTISRVEIRVGLYVSSESLPDPLVHADASVSEIGDPIRPYVYAMPDGSRLVATNIYTANVEKTYSLPVTGEICDVSDDGKYLFFEVVSGFDPSDPLPYRPRDVWRVDLDDETAPPKLLFTEAAAERGYSNGAFPVRYLSNNGVPLLLNPIGRVHSADSGDVLASFSWNWNGTSDQHYEVYYPTLVSVARDGKHVALVNDYGWLGQGLNIYSIRAYAVAGAPASVTLESTIPTKSFTEPGRILLGPDLDRVYVRFGYLEKVDISWVFHQKFNAEQRFLDGGNGVLFGTGEDAAHNFIVGQYSKNGDLVRRLSPPGGYWYAPLLSSDGLMVFATTDVVGGGSATYGFRR